MLCAGHGLASAVYPDGQNEMLFILLGRTNALSVSTCTDWLSRAGCCPACSSVGLAAVRNDNSTLTRTIPSPTRRPVRLSYLQRNDSFGYFNYT